MYCFQGREETSSNYCYIFDDGLELRPPPENLEALLHSVARVERLNQRLEETEEEIVALRWRRIPPCFFFFNSLFTIFISASLNFLFLPRLSFSFGFWI